MKKTISVSQIKQAVNEAYDLYKNNQDGKNADYIPYLANIDKNLFGISVCLLDGQIIEVGDTLHQPRQPSRTEVQGGVDRSERGAVGGVCHGGIGCRVPDLYHRREREDGGVRTGGRAGRGFGACHQATGGDEV